MEDMEQLVVCGGSEGDFAGADLLHRLGSFRELQIDQLAQVHLLIAGHDVVCRDIADHTRYARERRRGQHVFG